MISKKDFKKPLIKFYILILASIFVVTIFLYYKSIVVYNDQSREIVKIEIKHLKDFSSNISHKIMKVAGDNMVQNIKKDKVLQEKSNELLSLFATKQYKYIYILYKDKDNSLRYLADGSKKISERGEIDQKFTPMSDIWDKLIQTHKDQYTLQEKLTGLWMTYIYPIEGKNSLKAILVFDVSLSEYNTLFSIIKPIRNILYYFTIFLFLLFLFSLFQAFLYFKQVKSSHIDPLTKIHNRNYLDSIRNNINLENCAIALLDIDFFKKVNDTYGHDTGDIVLQNIAKRLTISTRVFDEIIRYGGEEFLIILNRQENIKNAKEICNRILKTISSKPIRIDDKSIKVTASIGLNSIPAKYKTLEQSIKKADEMLYEAKRLGRNRVITLSETIEQENILMLNEIISAIKEGRLKAFFQPVLDIKSGRIVEYEALARIIDKKGSIYLPSKFLPIIQKTPSYCILTRNIIEQSFQMIRVHNLNVSVNLNMNDFMNNTIFSDIKHLIGLNKDISSFLTIEIIDNKYVENIKKVIKRINELKKLGVKITLDSFGNNQSGIEILAEIKPDFIKIDGEIISQITQNGKMPKIILDIISICKTLKIKTIAEFVENKKILDILKKNGIDMAQGYYIGKPINLLSRKWAPKVLFFK